MIGKLIDGALSAPGKVVEATAETLIRLPGVPLDVADKMVKGAERGMEKLTDPDRRRP